MKHEQAWYNPQTGFAGCQCGEIATPVDLATHIECKEAVDEKFRRLEVWREHHVQETTPRTTTMEG